MCSAVAPSQYITADPKSPDKPRKTRSACYERVSTEEQVHGYSIATQIAALDEYCAKHDYAIVGHYTDGGISGGKPASKRPAMSQLLQDVEAGLIDLVLFCKLDRWFRNVREYFKTQEILDAHGVSWNAILEDYETETANGRMTVTIMLSVAQNERERTSERIKAVFDYRRAAGEVLTAGAAVPVGFKVENKRLVKDPATEPAVNAFFSYIIAGHSIRSALITTRAEYPYFNPSISGARYIARNPFYAGIHNGTEGYCPAYISVQDHERILAQKRTRTPKTDRVFMFSGLLHCPVCGYRLTPCYTSGKTKNYKTYLYYACSRHRNAHNCANKSMLAEKAIETALCALLFKPGEISVDAIRPTTAAQKPAENEAQLIARQKRLAETYTDGLIDHDEYKKQLADIHAKLDAIRNAPKTRSAPSLSLARELLNGDLQTVYSGLSAQEKQVFWRRVLRSATIDGSYHVLSVDFFD